MSAESLQHEAERQLLLGAQIDFWRQCLRQARSQSALNTITCRATKQLKDTSFIMGTLYEECYASGWGAWSEVRTLPQQEQPVLVELKGDVDQQEATHTGFAVANLTGTPDIYFELVSDHVRLDKERPTYSNILELNTYLLADTALVVPKREFELNGFVPQRRMPAPQPIEISGKQILH